MNVAAAITVAPSSGNAVFLPIRNRYVFGPSPRFLSTRIPSIITTALSTSIPIAMMNAPNEIRCNVVPITSRIGNDTATVSTSPKPMMTPLRNPIVKTSTRITIRTDSSKFSMKDEMAALTLSGWKKILSIVNPAGRVFSKLASLSSTALPTSGTIASSSIAAQMANAGSLSTKNPLR